MVASGYVEDTPGQQRANRTANHPAEQDNPKNGAMRSGPKQLCDSGRHYCEEAAVGKAVYGGKE